MPFDPHSLARRVAGRPLAALALAAAPLAGSASDPFAPGLRWSASPPAFEAALPRSVAFAQDGELVWAGLAHEHPRLVLYAASATTGAEAPLLQSAEIPGAIGVIPVVAGDARHLFAAPQLPDPDATRRRTEVVRFDAFAAAQVGATTSFTPVWTRVLPVYANGPALLAGDAAGLAAVVHDPSMGAAHLEWIDPSTGAPTATIELNGGSLGAFVAGVGADRVALTAGLELWVVDRTGLVAHHETLASATSCLALSADGKTLVVGGFGGARVLVQGANGVFAEAAPIAGGAQDIAARAAVSADGASVAAAFWNFTNGADVRVVWRGAGGALHADATWIGGAGPQNYPQELALTPDGSRLALAMWGQGGPEPEIVVFQADAPDPAFAWGLSGSPLAMAFADGGTRVAIAEKATHANQFATTGRVGVLDTGERDLQLVGPARPGGTLRLALLHGGAQQAIFGVGSAARTPIALPGFDGWMRLDPNAPILAFPSAADAGGHAGVTLAIPPGATAVGLPLAAQAVALTGAGPAFSAELVLPAIL